MTTTYKMQPGAEPTTKQADLLRRLAHELGKDMERADEILATRDRAGVSAIIDQLFAEQRAARPADAMPQKTAGYYLDAKGDAFVVVPNKAKTRTYAKKLTFIGNVEGDQMPRWIYTPGAVYDLASLVKLTLDEAARLSHLCGRCIFCGRALEDPKSVNRGIGPVCIKKLAA
jgi:hypothetical protein